MQHCKRQTSFLFNRKKKYKKASWEKLFSGMSMTHSILFFYLQQFWQPGLQPSTSQDVKPFAQPGYPPGGKTATAVSAIDGNLQAQHPWEGRSIATQKFRLVEFSAYLDLSADDTVSDVRRLATFCLEFSLNISSILVSQASLCTYSRAAIPSTPGIRRRERNLR